MVCTRFVCLSDTHGYSPGEAFKLPKGDVLIHAGDITNRGSVQELDKSLQWIFDADFEAKIIIAGGQDSMPGLREFRSCRPGLLMYAEA